MDRALQNYRATRLLTGRSRAKHVVGRLMEAASGHPRQFMVDVDALRESPELIRTFSDRLNGMVARTSGGDVFDQLNTLRQVCDDYFRAPYCMPRPGDVVVDAGANVGWFTIVASRLEPTALMHPFEPWPPAYERLLANLEANHVKHVYPRDLALGAEAGRLALRPTQHGHMGSFASHIADRDHGVDVSVARLDDLLDRADVVKIDVEGFEAEAVVGAHRILEDARLVVLEWHSAELLSRLCDELVRAGLEVDSGYSDDLTKPLGIAYFPRR